MEGGALRSRVTGIEQATAAHMSNKSGAMGGAVCMFVEGKGARNRTEYAWKRCGLALKIGREQDKCALAAKMVQPQPKTGRALKSMQNCNQNSRKEVFLKRVNSALTRD